MTPDDVVAGELMLVVEVSGGHRRALRLSDVDRLVEVSTSAVTRADDGRELVPLESRSLPLVRLTPDDSDGVLHLVIGTLATRSFALAVDRVHSVRMAEAVHPGSGAARQTVDLDGDTLDVLDLTEAIHQLSTDRTGKLMTTGAFETAGAPA